MGSMTNFFKHTKSGGEDECDDARSDARENGIDGWMIREVREERCNDNDDEKGRNDCSYCRSGSTSFSRYTEARVECHVDGKDTRESLCQCDALPEFGVV